MRLLFLVFTFFAISLNISYAKDSLQLGGYKADNCDVIIFLEKQNELFSYRVESEELNFSGQVSFSDNNLKAFREKYNIVTVPGFIVNKSGKIEVKCDSSTPEDEILKMIN